MFSLQKEWPYKGGEGLLYNIGYNEKIGFTIFYKISNEIEMIALDQRNMLNRPLNKVNQKL